MARPAILCALLILGGIATQVDSQEPARVVKMQTLNVSDNLYLITSSTPGPEFTGGNTGVFVTDSGVIVVDTKLSGYGPTIIEKIKRVTDKPVTMIINTHTHGDHTGSNEFFGTTVDSIVQENTKANMTKMDAFKGDKAQFLPKRTYKDKMTVGSGADQIDLYYFGPGHTSGDTFIVFRALRTMHAGDMFPWKDAPFIDRNNGGSGVEWPKTLDKLLKGVTGVDTVIGGHQPVATWKDLDTYQHFTADLATASQAAMKAGKSVDEAVASMNFASKYPGFESVRLKAAVQALYDELK